MSIAICIELVSSGCFAHRVSRQVTEGMLTTSASPWLLP
nr:MAG TPA: hypothetical protein [Caudoviricetes sp.]